MRKTTIVMLAMFAALACDPAKAPADVEDAGAAADTERADAGKPAGDAAAVDAGKTAEPLADVDPK
jgi:hypothetical protein